MPPPVETIGPSRQPASVLASNLLLDSLSAADRALIMPDLETVHLARGEVLFEPGDEVTHVLFPLDGTLASLMVPMQDGRTVETATVGHEGAIGGVVSHGYLPAFNRALVRLGGRALRIQASRLQKAKQSSTLIRNILTRYADCLLAQVLQSVACNAVHSIEQRSAKWLLTLHDRLGTDELPITQDVLADMLGVRRTYLSAVLRGLQAQEVIVTSRGCLHIRDRDRLHRAACECHGRVRDHFTEVMGAMYRADGVLVGLDPRAATAPAPGHIA